MADRYTPEQRAAIDAQGKVIVSASAGSGKTTVMIQKIINLICSGVDVGEILAVTFTKKAASQMKEKLAKALIKSINTDGISEDEKKRLKRQLIDVPSADISTIHSFCSKLIKTHFYKVGVDNGLRVIGGDDAEGLTLKNQALDDLFEEGYENREADFEHLLSVYWRKKSDNALRRIFLSAYNGLRDRADYREYLQRTTQYSKETFEEICVDLRNLFARKCGYYLRLVEGELDFFKARQSKAQTLLCLELSDWLKALMACDNYFAMANVAKPKFTSNRKAKDEDEDGLLHIERLSFLKSRITKAHEEEFSKLRDKETEWDAFERSGKTAAALAKYLLIFDKKYEDLKTERGVLDYNDLEHKALALLSEEEIVQEMRAKYRYVFVDEYQDVNPVQEAIVSKISGDNLFLVGDVKQSIYGFRGSKSKFFVQKQKQFENGDGQSLMMTKNFRSSDMVLDAVNKQFCLAMTKEYGDVDYARDSFMDKGGMYALNSGKVHIHFLPKEEKTREQPSKVYSVKRHTDTSALEESSSAKLIRHIVEEERLSTWFDAETKEERSVAYADIAVLSRKMKGQIAKTVTALSASGMPVSTASAVNVCEYAEVKTLIDILLLLDNAAQDVPLASALLSIGGLTANDLAKIRLYNKESKFFRDACTGYAETQQDLLAAKLKKFYAYFDEIRTLSRVLSASELLARILSETRLEARWTAKKNGVSAIKRVHRFLEEATLPTPLSVHEFLEKLREMDYEIEYNEGGGEDAVKVMTMHSSKGLEYPIVILDNLSGSFHGVDHDEVFVEEKFGLAPRAFYHENMTKTSTLLRRLHEWKEQESATADALNLYYVALTRAKYGLHLIFDEKTPMADVKYAKSFAEFTDFAVWKDYIVEDQIFNLPRAERQALIQETNEQLTDEIVRAYSWKYAHTGAENLPVKSSATQLIKGEDVVGEYAQEGVADEQTDVVQEKAARLFDENVEVGAAAWQVGVAYHAFLEKFNFALLYDEQGQPIDKITLRGYVEEALESGFFANEPDKALVKAGQLTEILSNPVFYELRDMRLYKEQQFLVGLPVTQTYAKKAGIAIDCTDDEEMIFQGAIDLLAVGDEVRIIDYKYSVHDGEYLRKKYKLQLELYRLATAKIMGIAPEKIRCCIVNIAQGFQVDMD